MKRWLRLRQICLVAEEIEPVVADLEAIFGLSVCHVDPGVAVFGLENALLPVGNQFLEVVTPIRDQAAAQRYLKRRGGDGGYMVITQCNDLPNRRSRVAELGVRIAFEIDRSDFHCLQLHPADTGGTFFEIDWQCDGDEPDGPWWPAGPDWQAGRRSDVVSAIRAAELQSPDPIGLAARWSEIAEIPLSEDADGNPSLALENAEIRFVRAEDDRGEGLGGVDLCAVDRARALDAARERSRLIDDNTVLICGTRFRLR